MEFLSHPKDPPSKRFQKNEKRTTVTEFLSTISKQFHKYTVQNQTILENRREKSVLLIEMSFPGKSQI
jgi:hypothetical protein